MVIKVGKFGPFLACSGYPECTNTRELETSEPGADSDETQDETCENCGKPMVVKRGRFGQFLACTGYPECKTTRKIIATKQGDDGGQAGSDPRREVPEVRLEPRHQAGPLRRVHRVHELSRTASTSSRRPPACCARRTAATSSSASRGGARCSYGCANYPDCDFTLWNRPIAGSRAPTAARRSCVEKITKKAGRQLICSNEDCVRTCETRRWKRA